MSGDGLREGDLLTVPQALAVMPVGRSTLYTLLDSGQLPHYRVKAPGSRRGRVLIAKADLGAFLAGSRHEARRAPVGVDADAVLARVRGRNGSPARA